MQVSISDHIVLLSDEDAYLLDEHRWFATPCNGITYIGCNIKTGKIGNRSQYKRHLMHRIIMNTPKGMQVDHINGNSLDNRRENLRNCTNQQNQFNRKPQKNCSSQFKGVNWHKAAKKWHVRVFINGQPGGRINLGLFDSEIEAAKAYNRVALQHFGEFARLNPV